VGQSQSVREKQVVESDPPDFHYTDSVGDHAAEIADGDRFPWRPRQVTDGGLGIRFLEINNLQY
jgi:hypothetical protein